VIAAFIPDLLFGSNVVASLTAAGHEVRLVSTPEGIEDAEALIVDLTADAEARVAALPQTRPPTLAFYAHVEVDVRRLAEDAGIELVVPRSRMAREGPALVQRLIANA
jgi:nucleoside-diphosphate-sugar epimerase